MRKIKKTLLLVTLVCLVFMGYNFRSVSAFDDSLYFEGEDIGEYIRTEPVMRTIKVFITEETVDFIESTGTDVITNEIRHYFLGIYIYSSYRYYYYVDEFVEEVIEERVLRNDMDSLIFVVQELEYYASIYDSCKGQAMNNCVIGYIRGINKNYIHYWDDLRTLQWYIVEGNINQGFIDFVDSKDGDSLEIAEFFSAFLSYSDYNYDDYGSSEYKYRSLNYGVIDPFNDNSEIDVIHMFSAIDGIYNASGQILYMPNMISWAGDLQTIAADISEHSINPSIIENEIDSWNIYMNDTLDFCDLIQLENCHFGEKDLLADIDAMNITQVFVNNIVEYSSGGTHYDDLNVVSDALTGYYNIINHDNSYYPNRYKMFLTSVAMQNGELLTDNNHLFFEDLVYDRMYISYNDGAFEGKTIVLGTYTTKLYYVYNDLNYKADLDSRVIAAKLFKEYILYMSSRPYYN